MSAICIIGNSHAACIRRPSLAISQEQKKTKFVFFCARDIPTQALARRGQLLVPRSAELREIYKRTSRGAEEIDEDIYDAFIVVGLQFGIETVLPIYHDYRTSRMNHSRSKYLVSEAYFRSAACDALRTSEAVRIAKMIRSVSRKPIILVPNPRRVLNLQGKRYGAISRASGAELALLDQEYRMACTSAVSASVIVHHQPDETLADGFHTRAELGLSANIPDLSEIPPSRFTHMNEAYGSLLLNSIIGRLGSLLPRRWAKGG